MHSDDSALLEPWSILPSRALCRTISGRGLNCPLLCLVTHFCTNPWDCGLPSSEPDAAHSYHAHACHDICGCSTPGHLCAPAYHSCPCSGAWQWSCGRQDIADLPAWLLLKLQARPCFIWPCRCPYCFRSWTASLRPRPGPLPFLAGLADTYPGDPAPWLSSGRSAMPPRHDHRAQPWSEEQVSRLDCTTLHPGAEAICVGGVHFASLRGRLLLVLPHAQGTHSSDEFSYNVRIVGQSCGKVYSISRDHLESPDDDTPRPRVQDDGLLGPRLRWILFPPPLTLFTAPVLLGWRHLPQADSFFWRKDVEDHALARYTTGATAAVDPGEAMDAATMSSESFEEVLIEEPDIEQPAAPADGYEAEEEMSGMSGPAATAPLAEEEMPIYIQAGDVRLSSHDYHDDDYPTRPATAKRHRSRSRHRSSVKHHAATDVATPAEPASSSRGAFPPEPPVPEPSVASVASDAAVKTATATTSAWTIPQWARKAINKRLKERRARVPSEEPPPRPRGKSIWFMSEDEAEDAGLVQQGRSSHIPRVEDPAVPDAARSSRDAYMNAVCQLTLAWISSHLCLTAPPVPLPSPRFGETRLGLHWSAAVAHSALVSCVCLMSSSLGACAHGSGQLGIEPPSWLLDDMPNFWQKGPSSWSSSAAFCLVRLSRLRLIHDQTNTCLTGHPPQISAIHNIRMQLEIACIRPAPQRAALLSLHPDLSLPSWSRPPPLLCVRGLLHLKQAPIRFSLITRRPVRLLSSSTFTLWTDVPRPQFMLHALYRRVVLLHTSSVTVFGSAALSMNFPFLAGLCLKHTSTLCSCGVRLVQCISLLARPPWHLVRHRQRRLPLVPGAASDPQRTLHLHRCRNGPPGCQESRTLWTTSSIVRLRKWRHRIPTIRQLWQDLEAPDQAPVVASKVWRTFTRAVQRKDRMMMMTPSTVKLLDCRHWRIPQLRHVPWLIVMQLPGEATRGEACLPRRHQLTLFRQNPLTPFPRLRHCIRLLSAGLTWVPRTSTHSVTFRWIWFFAPRRLISSVLDTGSSPSAVRQVGPLKHPACVQNLCSLPLCFLLPLIGADPQHSSYLPTERSLSQVPPWQLAALHSARAVMFLTYEAENAPLWHLADLPATLEPSCVCAWSALLAIAS